MNDRMFSSNNPLIGCFFVAKYHYFLGLIALVVVVVDILDLAPILLIKGVIDQLKKPKAFFK